LTLLLIVAISGWAALAGTVFGFGLKCGDSCSNIGGAWREDPDSWQWSALGWSGIGVFSSALLLLAALIARRRVLAWIAAGGWVALGVAFLVLLDGSGLA
jgi:hypothetical protein